MLDPRPLRGLYYATLVAAAVVSVLVSTPSTAITKAIVDACQDVIFAVDDDVMYDMVMTAPFSSTNPRASCDDGPGFNSFSVDLAPDGSHYGAVRATCFTASKWGRINPAVSDGDLGDGVSPVYVPLGDLPLTYTWPKIPAFLPDFPAPGQPFGYRFNTNDPGRQIVAPEYPLQLYAIDSISPYREHLVSESFGPIRANVGLGTLVSKDGSKLWYPTTDGVYEINVADLSVVQRAFLRFYAITSDAIVVNSSEDGVFWLINFNRALRIDMRMEPPAITVSPFDSLTRVVDASRYTCVPGGMRIEPHAELVTTEAGGTAAFTAVLTAPPTEDVTVTFSSTDTSEGTVSPPSATFTSGNWDTPQTITVTGVQDNDTADQTFRITTSNLASADANFNGRVVLDVDVTNTNVNQLPTFTPGAASVVQASAATTNTLGTDASDGETPTGSLTASAVVVPLGLTVGAITNTAGTFTAPVAASCSATLGAQNVTVRVSDGNGGTFDADVPVTVTANPAPTIGAYSAASVLLGGGTTITPTVAPADNGSIATVTAAAPGFTGTFSGNPVTGTITASNAGPVGWHTVTVTATDNCGATTTRTLTLYVSGGTADTCEDRLFMVYQSVIYDVPSGSLVPQNPRSTCDALNTAASFRVDLAPDGSHYGWIGGACHGGPDKWGRFDPLAGNTDPGDGVSALYAPLNDLPASYAWPRQPAFLPSFPAPGQPFGYRFNTNHPDFEVDSSFPLQLYAIDSLSPYREHLVVADAFTGSGLPSLDFGLGTVVSKDGSKVWYVTTTGIYLLDLTAGGPIQEVGSLGLFSLSRNTVVISSSHDGIFWLMDFQRVFRVDAVSGDVVDSSSTGLLQAVDASRYACVPGGMRIEPHTELVTTEAGGTASFTAVLTAPPAADVFVTFTSTDTSEVSVNPSIAMFSSGNWNTPQTITVTGQLDSDTTNQPFRILTSNLSSGDPSFNDRDVLDVDVTNTNVNQLPTMGGADVFVRQGNPASIQSLGSVGDYETDPAALTVATQAVPSGLTVGPVTNTLGALTASVAASCSAATGTNLVALRVTDGNGGTFDTNVPVNVQPNTTPFLPGYAWVSVPPGGALTNTPVTGPQDTGPFTIDASSPTFTGILSVNSVTGAVSISNAAPSGVHTVTVTVTDACGVTVSSAFQLTVNAVPTLTPGAPSVQQGSPASIVTLGTVSDADNAPESLSITPVYFPIGLVFGDLVNTGGTISTMLSATCSATPGPITLPLRVADGLITIDQNVDVTVLANTAPTIGSYDAVSVRPGFSTTILPSAAPFDSGTSRFVQASSPTFTGSLFALQENGAVFISNAGPSGVHTVTVTVTDNCGAQVSRTFQLTVNALPTFTPTGVLMVQQGSPAATVTLGNASDAETPAAALTVTPVAVPTGLTLGAITNTGGTITTPLSASCVAPPGSPTLTLRVTDGIGATTDQGVVIGVQLNGAPFAGFYSPASIAFGAGATIQPLQTATDNGSVSLLEVSAPGFTGSISVNASGVVSISNAGPIGAHTITITATDNCGATSTTTFTLTVTCPAFSLAAPGASFTLGGGAGSVAVTAAPGCAWTSSNTTPWINMVNGNGTGNGLATFTVTPNSTGVPRGATLTIGGQPFAVTQSFGFADPVIVAGTTPIRAIHLLELRIRIDRLRAKLGLPAYPWNEANLAAGLTLIRAAHVIELRTAVLQTYAVTSQAEPAFTDESLGNARLVRASHVNELRAAIIALENALQ